MAASTVAALVAALSVLVAGLTPFVWVSGRRPRAFAAT